MERYEENSTSSTSATRDQQITHTNNLKIDIVDIVDIDATTSTTSTRRLWKRVNAGLEGEGTTERESEELQLEYKLVSSSQMKKHIQGFLKQHRGDWLNMVETGFTENNASNW
jgi:hypothetical protein